MRRWSAAGTTRPCACGTCARAPSTPSRASRRLRTRSPPSSSPSGAPRAACSQAPLACPAHCAHAAVQPPRGSVHVRAPRERQGRGIPCTPRVCAALVCMSGWHGLIWQRRSSALAVVHRTPHWLLAAGLGQGAPYPALNPVAKQAAGSAQGGDRCGGRAVGPQLRIAVSSCLSVPVSIQLPAQGGDRGGQRGRQRALL